MEQDKNFLVALQDIYKIVENNPSNIPPEVKKQFWRIVSRIKRDPSPDQEEVELAARIRDALYSERLGSPRSLRVTIPLWTLCGAGFAAISVLIRMPGMLELSLIFSLFPLMFFMMGYGWILNLGKMKNFLLVISMVGLTVVLFLLLLLISTDLLLITAYMFMFITIPCFYPHGRLAGGFIGGIKFDGMTRDVFYLPTLKINYRSYLLAQPPERQWIFFCGGIGTVVTAGLLSTIHLLLFNDSLFYIVMFVLLFGEYLDFLGRGGPLSGGEMHHLRRERRIIQDWKKKLSNQRKSD